MDERVNRAARDLTGYYGIEHVAWAAKLTEMMNGVLSNLELSDDIIAVFVETVGETNEIKVSLANKDNESVAITLQVVDVNDV